MSVSTAWSPGMDTTTIISQLMQTEAEPADRRSSQAVDHADRASAYRTVNTTFAALTAAADAAHQPDAGRRRRRRAPTTTVTASAADGRRRRARSPSPSPASPRTQSVISNDRRWTSPTRRALPAAWPGRSRSSTATAPVVGTRHRSPPATARLDRRRRRDQREQPRPHGRRRPGRRGTEFRLQVTSETTGAASAFIARSAPRPHDAGFGVRHASAAGRRRSTSAAAVDASPRRPTPSASCSAASRVTVSKADPPRR